MRSSDRRRQDMIPVWAVRLRSLSNLSILMKDCIVHPDRGFKQKDDVFGQSRSPEAEPRGTISQDLSAGGVAPRHKMVSEAGAAPRYPTSLSLLFPTLQKCSRTLAPTAFLGVSYPAWDGQASTQGT